MFKKIFKKQEEKKSDNAQNILIAALLIHAAKIDEKYTDQEKLIIKKALMNLNNMNSDQIEKLMTLAEKKEEEQNQIIEFTREIKKISMESRLKIIEIIWKIVYSDGVSDSYESNLIRRICGLLYISDRESGIIKLRVKNQDNKKWPISLMTNVLSAN